MFPKDSWEKDDIVVVGNLGGKILGFNGPSTQVMVEHRDNENKPYKRWYNVKDLPPLVSPAPDAKTIPLPEVEAANIRVENDDVLKNFEQTAGYMTALAGLSHIAIALDTAKPEGAATGTIRGAEVYVNSDQVIDTEAERDRLMKEIAKISKDIDVFSKKLSNKNFVDKAPKEVVEKDTVKLEEFKAKHEKLEQRLAVLGS